MCVDIWLNASASNTAGAITGGSNYNWIDGNIFFDRDRFGLPRAWGMSLGDGRVTVGLNVGGTTRTYATSTSILGAGWRHIRFQRAVATGNVQVYVHGVREINDSSGPAGDLSCPSTGNSGWDGYLILGVEKHDAAIGSYPSYYGGMSDILLRNVIPSVGSTISVPTEPWGAGVSGGQSLWPCNDSAGTALADAIGNCPGTLLVGGGYPQWSSLSPYS